MSEAQRMPLTGSFNYGNGHINGVISLRSSASRTAIDVFCHALGGKRPIHSILIANNGMVAVKGHASEISELPDALEATGIIFLGPPATSMAALGDKIGSSLIAQAADVLTLPWSCSHVKIPVNGCRGGKGIRKVYNDKEVKALFKQHPNFEDNKDLPKDSDSFGLGPFIKQRIGKDTMLNRSDTPVFPSGFTPSPTGDQSDSNHKPSDGVSFNNPGFSILERLEETIKVGLALGLNMEGCESTLASLVAEKGEFNVDLWMIRQAWGNAQFDFASTSARGKSGVVDGYWFPGAVQIRWIVVYAPQPLSSKIALWSSLSNLIGNWDGVLIMMGDFNEVREASERVVEKGIPDHRHFLLKETVVDYGPTPFRFFQTWLDMDGFQDLVVDTWKNDGIVESNSLISFKKKLQNLKQVIRNWVATKKVESHKLRKDHQHRLSIIDAKVDKGDASKEDFINRKHSLTVLGDLDRVEAKDLAQKAKIKWALEVLEKIGFGLKWRSWINGCLRNARSSVLVNGSPTDEFELFKGLRQGDPLSHFLFILAMEGLHALTCKADELGLFKVASIGRDIMNISHLMYADDVIFFVFLVFVFLKEMLLVWQTLLDKFSSKLTLWKARLLLVGGRLSLIKSVIGLATFRLGLFSAFMGPREHDVLRRVPKGGAEMSQFVALQAALGVPSQVNVTLGNGRLTVLVVFHCICSFFGRSSYFRHRSRAVMAKYYWSLLASWWDLDIPMCANIMDWFDWLDSLHVTNRAHAFLEGVRGRGAPMVHIELS
uniref:RNA-directed DNA polymerase, eukaryota, reverse transcriptase zinc-binding domain protein n=1 Tax=Tanacetum cinerariifolium TaxID=118510 RepID=A0A699GXW7_TANCI|nr:RNA-directed DNA polymerase, eukaryota, reverse transcriptase zinc-binding domain protein [Tanacetum cinerariifolium]